VGASGLKRYEEEPDAAEAAQLTWWEILSRWQLVQLDMHQTYGIDMGDRDLLRSRSWPWLRLRVVGLVSEPGTRLQRALRPSETPASMLPPELYATVTKQAVHAAIVGAFRK